ncbi:DNA topoisomerase (ATP-hydrolyzing) subunit A (plasmid) [Entomospira entomophila]|uniref:DNA topoisomerase (ATP-hydrolyzing) n=1 Tax=Entomospira entomophila TaxID=2719988 RepID=A0A968KUG4_9SPIO|nr:DNA topoisomerase (ATP-hydrolyzing) subunit A [Entomospira entomophilus]NIZ41446.1 DNA topoisomerase (ATP-hydrolyzing) subunit A [Entomospira entomophilus]WDI36280.1 DNA topoisomerase (ATP-hydrolyzing) subunit A [Entomospira entomophilus]
MHEESIIHVAIEKELKESYLTYAMSVIVARALPDVRDGLKPVHRRVIYGMSQLNLDRRTKCAKIVGDVMGSYHPHGDAAIYDTLVRMAQDFSLRYPLVAGEGNFGSIDGDPAAAMRYTEAKMAKITETLLRDIKKDTVAFVPNYDGSTLEPTVLPAALPNLLINGSTGIAVGMSTSMPPHNLREVSQAIIATLDNPDITIEELLTYIKAPDFPGGATIHGLSGYRQAAFTGKGSVVVRAKIDIEEHGNRTALVVTELPYMTNKRNLLVQIAQLVKDKRIDSITSITDASAQGAIRIVIELKRDAQPDVTINQLYQSSSLQSAFHINNLALVNGQPKTLSLKDMIRHFIAHRHEVILNRSHFELKKLQERAHILEGLTIALENIDAVIALIKESVNSATARERLMQQYLLSEVQAIAILEMRLQRLTNMEVQKIVDELTSIRQEIAYLNDLIANPEKIYGIIRTDTQSIAQVYGDDRRTQIVLQEVNGMVIEDLIEREEMVVLMSKRGFVKRVPLSEYKEQSRGGKGSLSAKLGDDDYVEHLFTGSTHDILMIITSKGKGYWLKIHQLPLASRQAKGRHLNTIFEFEEGEEISESVVIDAFHDDHYLLMATRRGIVKRVALSAFKNAKMRGIIAIDLDEGDHLHKAVVTNGDNMIMLISQQGRALRLHESKIRASGRSARGVRGIRLQEQDALVGVAVEQSTDQQILILSEHGFGKRTLMQHFTPHARGTAGQKVANTTNPKYGLIFSAIDCDDEKSLLVITASGKTMKTALTNIPLLGRTAGGVRIVRLTDSDNVVGLATANKSVDFGDTDEELEATSIESQEIIDEIDDDIIDDDAGDSEPDDQE